MIVRLGGLRQLRSDIEFLIMIELQACCVSGLQVLHEQILHVKHIVGLHTHDAALALPLHLQLARTALAVFCDQHVVAHLEFGERICVTSLCF
jgi:hypothetical protein